MSLSNVPHTNLSTNANLLYSVINLNMETHIVTLTVHPTGININPSPSILASSDAFHTRPGGKRRGQPPTGTTSYPHFRSIAEGPWSAGSQSDNAPSVSPSVYADQYAPSTHRASAAGGYRGPTGLPLPSEAVIAETPVALVPLRHRRRQSIRELCCLPNLSSSRFLRRYNPSLHLTSQLPM